ncbi:MBL fold metallo-hydrolase [Streptomyces sp. B3I8]|uniref:MBL fold metallo-hydrolase n=1 Tax=Streptomyces sp. B3I8 TaxID=3042303 RepID=UPI002786E55A|nr:MBL fold metallo-hydrolase [Streptomyces sp. B3I8]MDQ0791399.1 L-ascorbate metabolism protein UlaG (beta-lactamase superfamily) [Streptomyces sp. B3I8]
MTTDTTSDATPRITPDTTPDVTSGALRLRRLGWAGVEILLGGTRLLIDPLENVGPLEPALGKPKRPLPPVETPGGVEAPEGTHVLLTHLHPDHYDRELLTRLAGSGTVGCHTPVAPALARDGVEAVPQERGRARRIGPLTVTPVASLDWRGSESDQVAWVVEGAGTRIIHCGDTMWHGDWWKIARDHGPFDLAFLPVNGVIAKFEGYEADVPVTLTPEQAVEAAAVLGATAVCAIHYELFDNPPTYVEQPDIAGRFVRAAAKRGLIAHLPGDGEAVPLVTRRAGRAAR